MGYFLYFWLRLVTLVTFIHIDSSSAIDANLLNIGIPNTSELASTITPVKPSEDYTLDFIGLAQKYGFQAQAFNVITEDGYNLTIFRIPGEGEPLVFQHGVLDSSNIWLLRGNNSLAIDAASNGYDVWCGNMRGNRYGRKHISLNPDTDKSFWNFTFFEHGYYDLAAIVDFVLSKTGVLSVSYIGHSQGTTISYILCSSRPEYNKKFKVIISLAPIAYLSNMRPLASTSADVGSILPILDKDGFQEVFGYNEIKILRLLCIQPVFDLACYSLEQSISGVDPIEVDKEFGQVLFGHYPAGTSLKNFYHFIQLKKYDAFSYYDYGDTENLQRYNSSKPPAFDLSKIIAKVVLIVGKNDNLSTVKDVTRLRNELSNVEYIEVSYPLMTHLGFVIGKNMNKYLFPLIYNNL